MTPHVCFAKVRRGWGDGQMAHLDVFVIASKPDGCKGGCSIYLEKDAVQDRCVTGTFIFFLNFICQKSEYHRVPLPLLHDIAVALPQRKHGPEEA